MNLDLGSFAFGSTLHSGVGTPSWGTALGQSRPDYKFTYSGAEAIVIGMAYCSVPLHAVKLPMGRGGHIYVASESRECQIASLFKKVYINGVRIPYPFLMVLTKELSDSHTGRRGIKYSDKIEYDAADGHYSNTEFIQQARSILGISDDGCWFVYRINIINQDELHMYAVIVNENASEVYTNSEERKRAWSALIPDTDDYFICTGDPNNSIDQHKLQIIYYGTPGSGKSFKVKNEVLNGIHENNIFRTTFHPDSDYASFVGCYKPIMKEVSDIDTAFTIYSVEELIEFLSKSRSANIPYAVQKFATKYWRSLDRLTPDDIKYILEESGVTESFNVEINKGVAVGKELAAGKEEIVYSFIPQSFTRAYIKAWQNPNEHIYLVIEEINRGNCAQIFGDLFQLLDRKNGVSEYPINADADLLQYLENKLGVENEGIANGKIRLPANLHILATMNTSDQSLFPMDSAFKRRWVWECVPIDYNNPDSSKFKSTIGNKQYNWNKFLKEANSRIFKATDSEDKQMGNFFINGDIDERDFIDKVMFYLWNDICKEEFGTTNNFFRNYTNDQKNENVEFTFNNLFETGQSTDLLQGFMDYIGVDEINGTSDTTMTRE